MDQQRAKDGLREIAQLSERHGAALVKAWRLLGAGALVGPEADDLTAQIRVQHRQIQAAFEEAYEEAYRLIEDPVGLQRPAMSALPAGGGAVRRGGAVGGDGDLLQRLSSALTGASSELGVAQAALAGVMSRLGLAAFSARPLGRASAWAAEHAMDVARRRDQLMRTVPQPAQGLLADGMMGLGSTSVSDGAGGMSDALTGTNVVSSTAAAAGSVGVPARDGHPGVPGRTSTSDGSSAHGTAGGTGTGDGPALSVPPRIGEDGWLESIWQTVTSVAAYQVEQGMQRLQELAGQAKEFIAAHTEAFRFLADAARWVGGTIMAVAGVLMVVAAFVPVLGWLAELPPNSSGRSCRGFGRNSASGSTTYSVVRRRSRSQG